MARVASALALTTSGLVAGCMSIADPKESPGAGGSIIASGGSATGGGGAPVGGSAGAGGVVSTGGGGSGGGVPCNEDCGGGACVGGECQPVELADDGSGPVSIAVDATHVYWASYTTGVRRVPKAGGSVEPIAVGESYVVVVDATSVYWIAYSGTGGGVMKAPKSPSPTATTLASAQAGAAKGLAVANGWVYWTTGDSIRRVQTAGGNIATVVPNLTAARSLVVADTGAPVWIEYPASNQGVIATYANAQRVVLASGQADPQRLIADGAIVYWGNHYGGGVMQVALDGGAPQPLSSWKGNPMGIASDADSVWFTSDNQGQILRVAKVGGSPSVVVDGQDHPQALAVDAKFVYWANNGGGKIMKLAK